MYTCTGYAMIEAVLYGIHLNSMNLSTVLSNVDLHHLLLEIDRQDLIPIS